MRRTAESQWVKKATRERASAGRRVVTLAAVLGAACLAYFGYLHLRNTALREKLRSCSSYGVVRADVYYAGAFSTETVVFDIGEGPAPGARRIDAVHLLMQLAGKLDLYSVKRLVLARGGDWKFVISGEDVRRLSESYAGGGRIWAFNNLPQSVRRMDGRPVYEEWYGGWLGVAQKQAEDLNDLIRAWTGQ